MAKWLNAADCLMNVMVDHLPSPKTAQKYRTDTLYSGPQDDGCARAMLNCDPNGPLMIYISRLMPINSYPRRYYAFGRIFSGTVATGMKVSVMGSSYQHGEKADYYECTIQRVVLMVNGTY